MTDQFFKTTASFDNENDDEDFGGTPRRLAPLSADRGHNPARQLGPIVPVPEPDGALPAGQPKLPGALRSVHSEHAAAA